MPLKYKENYLGNMQTNPKIDALQLMLTDLRTRHEPIRHKAAFRGCQPEFQSLVNKLITQLELTSLISKILDYFVLKIV